MRLGDELKKTREAKSISIQDVCDVIHLSPKQVGALENHLFSLLPGPMITRGFIRNYAKFLQIDPEPLLNSYRELVPDQGDASLIVNANVNSVMTDQQQQPWLMYILGSILTLLFLVAWFYYMDNVPEQTADTSVADIVVDASEVVSESPIEITAENVVQAPTEKPAAGVAAENTAAQASLPVVDESVDPSTKIVAPQVESTPADDGLTDPNAFVDTVELLAMQFPEESWLNVRDQYGKTVFKQLMAPGSEKALKIKKPFKLTIGNAINVTVQYEGLNVDLAPSTTHNVARLKVE